MKQIIFLLILLFSLSIQAQNNQEFQHSIAEAHSNKDTLTLARLWYKLGKYYDNNQQLEESIEALHRALYWAKSIKSHKAISSIANYLAANYSIASKSDSAILYYNHSIDACLALSDSLKMASVLINLGDEYATIGNYMEAANKALLAIRIKENVKDSVNLAFFYQKAGEVYKMAGENEKWEEYIKKAYQLIHIEKCSGISATAAIYNDLGGIAENRGDYTKALLYYDTLFSIGNENQFTKAVGIALSNSATVYKLQGDIDEALNNAIKAQKYKSQNPYQKIYDNNLLAELYLAKSNISEARKFAMLASKNNSIRNFPEEKTRVYKNLYLIEKKAGNFEKALAWNELYKQLSDSLREKEIRTKIVDLDLAYQTEKKEQQIKVLTTENKLKNQGIRAGIILLAILLVVILLILYIFQIKRKQAQLIQNELQQQVLRAQMNPHFIFNVLGSIQNFMQRNDLHKASNYLSQFASLIRATLHHSADETIALADEIEMLKNYTELERMRSNNRFNYQIKFNETLEVDFIKIPPMLIQPFVENSIKHGFKNLDYEGFLTIQITDKIDCIEFIIEDNGNGIQKNNDPVKTHQSMAIKIFEKRRKLIQQKHKKDFKFEMINLKDSNPDVSGLRIILIIPVLNNE